MNFSSWLIGGAARGLVACGGGGSDGAAAPAATVSAVTSDQALSYGKAAVLKVTGTNLNLGMTLTAPGCKVLTEQAGSTASARSYNCLVTVPTSLQLAVASSAGASLYSASLPVPDPQVTLVTSLGTILLELNPTKAPLTVDNFLKYSADGFYSNLTFHRVISSFMIQGGGFSAGPAPKTATYGPIKLESNNGLSNLRGTLAMARTSVADSATSQFFINVVDNTFLDYASAASPGYAVFGKVVDGMTVVDAIRAVPTGVRGGMTDVPLSDVLIVSALQTR
jgi:peptidyl-prolyl cis-trans isomerase A (cyclophilin A)